MDDINYDDLTPEQKAEWDKAQKKFQRRMMSMLVFCLVLAVPIGIGTYKLWKLYSHIHEAQVWAEAQLKTAAPDPRAYGDLGSIYLDQGKTEAALPLLAKAVGIEAKRGDSAQDHLTFAKANIIGLKKGLPGASKEAALKALDAAQKLAEGLPQGRAAATYHGAGMFYLQLEQRNQALECLKLASRLQSDDWVDEGGGKRYKLREISGAYAKDLAAALQSHP